VEPQSFAFGDYAGRKPGKRAFLLGLAIYDRMAGQHGRHYFGRDEFVAMAPNVATDGLQGGMVYTDAKTDDARLVLRVLQEARAAWRRRDQLHGRRAAARAGRRAACGCVMR
jgi:glycerol-3-phosphate dehydrogenase